MQNAEAASPLESVDRALQLVELLRSGERLSVKAAAAHLYVAPSTAHRLLNSLAYREFATQDRDRRYRAGPALVGPSRESLTVNVVRQAAHPVLESLQGTLGETVQLMVRRDTSIQFVDGIEAESLALRVGVRLGDRMPAYCSAGGKTLLADLSNPELEKLFHSGLPAWPTARILTVTALKRQLARVRSRGYGLNVEETEQGVNGLGVLVRSPAGKAIAALTVAIPTVRFNRDHVPHQVQALNAAAAALQERLAEDSDDNPEN